jgi:hypothetical protein
MRELEKMSAIMVDFGFKDYTANVILIEKTKENIYRTRKTVSFKEVEDISKHIADLICEYSKDKNLREVLIETNNLGIAVLNRVKEIIRFRSTNFPVDDIKGFVTKVYK